MIIYNDRETQQNAKNGGFLTKYNFHTITLSLFGLFYTFFSVSRLKAILHNILAFTPVKNAKNAQRIKRTKMVKAYCIKLALCVFSLRFNVLAFYAFPNDKEEVC